MDKQVPFHETLNLTLIGNMGRVNRLCREAVTHAVEPLGLTQSRWTTLMHIKMLSEGVTQLEIAHSLSIEMPSLTRILKQLEEQSLIIRRIDEYDKRSKKIYLTDKGRQILSSLQEEVDEITQQIYSGLNHQQLDAMAHHLIKLEQNAQACIKQQIQKKVKK